MLLRSKIAYYLEDFETPLGKTINFIIFGLILFSSGVFVAETYPFSESTKNIFHIIDIVITYIFAIEYLLRFWSAESKIQFFFSLFSIIDLIAILPLLFGFMDVRFIRLFRWFRFLRVMRFLKLEFFIFRIRTEDGIILTRILSILFAIIFIYSGLIYQVEHEVNPEEFRNFLDALYFSVVTMTTVGFGDMTPLSESGRLVTLLMILTGVMVIPWQLGDLVKQLIKTANHVEIVCSGCGLACHDTDAHYCKICGTKLDNNILNTEE